MPSKKRLLSVKEIAEEFGIAKRTLEYWRQLGTGPEYTMVGGKVMYARIDFEKFVAEGRVRPADKLPNMKRGRPRSMPEGRQ